MVKSVLMSLIAPVAIVALIFGGLYYWARRQRLLTTGQAAEGEQGTRRISLLTEAVAYIGVILLLVGGAAAIGQRWNGWSHDIDDQQALAASSRPTPPAAAVRPYYPRRPAEGPLRRDVTRGARPCPRHLRMFRVERLNLYRYASLNPFGVREGTGRTR